MDIVKICKRHGSWKHYLDKSCNTWKCKQCNSEKVIKRHRKVKRLLVDYKGGKCELCGYDKSIAAMQFHHIDPSQKDFGISTRMYSQALETLKREVDKCSLLCANCHFETHANEHM